MPAQTVQVLYGAAVALLYAATVLAVGSFSLALLLGPRRELFGARIGRVGLLWLAFVLGQGILGFLWLGLSLAGIFYPSAIWVVSLSGAMLAWARLLMTKHAYLTPFKQSRSDVSFLPQRNRWYVWLAIAIFSVALLRALISVSPPSVDDGLKHYLVWARMIAASHKIDVQPSLHPYYGLLPMQVEMHWAALFAISNETAVTLWDYLCSASFLMGVGFLAWSLTSDRRVASVAILIVLSTPAFYTMMGAGKIDNASAQYGIAAFVSVVLWPFVGTRAAILAGLCLGWSMASRYTNVIILPGLIAFAIIIGRRQFTLSPAKLLLTQFKKHHLTDAVLCCVAAAIVGAPMLVKNWLLVGCPLAPEFGCNGTSWASLYRLHTSDIQNISIVDFFLYPFVWTFFTRESMLGNISPLFLGLFPFLLAYRRHPGIAPALESGLAGLISIGAWLFIEPLVLFTRFFLVPLSLLAIPLSASAIAVERDYGQHTATRWLLRGAFGLVIVFLLFDCRGVIYAARYVTSMDSRADWYQSRQGYDVANWLNTHVRPGERVALGNYKGHRYFVDPKVLRNTESTEEYQWLWNHGQWLYGGSGSMTPVSWLPDFWRFYADHSFTYVVVPKNRVGQALSAWPTHIQGQRLYSVALGRSNDILKIEKP